MGFKIERKPVVHVTNEAYYYVSIAGDKILKGYQVIFEQIENSKAKDVHRVLLFGGIDVFFDDTSKLTSMRLPRQNEDELLDTGRTVYKETVYAIYDEQYSVDEIALRLFTPDVSDLNIKTVMTSGEFEELWEFVSARDVVTIDFETRNLEPTKKDSKILTCCFGDEKQAYVLPIHHKDSPFERNAATGALRFLMKHISDEQKQIVAHNSKYELRWLRTIGFDLGYRPDLVFADPMLMHYLCDEGASHSLDSLTAEYFPRFAGYSNSIQATLQEKHNYESVPFETLCLYNGLDVIMTARLVPFMRDLMRKERVEHMWSMFYQPLVPVLTDIEAEGFEIDRNVLDSLDREYASLVEKHEAEFLRASGVDFEVNMNSNKQISYILYDLLKLPVRKRTDSGAPSTNEKTLRSVMSSLPEKDNRKRAALQSYISRTKANTMYSNFISKFREQNEENLDGRLRTNYNLHVVETGRLSSSNPNMQNIPASAALVENGFPPVKTVFVSRFGKQGLIVQADYSQLELRVAAMCSGDPVFVKAFKDGKDLHGETAQHVYGDGYSKDERTRAKRTNFAAIFDVSDKTLSENLDIDIDEAARLLDGFRSLHPELYEYFDKIWAKAQKDGYSLSFNNRRRRIAKELREAKESGKKYRVEAVKRQVWNFPIQSAASDLTLTGIMMLWHEMRERKMKSLIFGTVHDSVLIDTTKAELDTVVSMVREIFTVTVPDHYEWARSVPLKIDISVGKNMYEMKEL